MTKCENKLYDSDGFDYTDKLNNLKLKEIDLSKVEIKSNIYLMELAIISAMFDKLKTFDENGNSIMLYDKEQVKNIRKSIGNLKFKISSENTELSKPILQNLLLLQMILDILENNGAISF